MKGKIERGWAKSNGRGIKREGRYLRWMGAKKVRGLRSVIKSKKEVKCKIGRGAKGNGQG